MTNQCFAQLKTLLLPFEKSLWVVHNKPDNYYLHTRPTTQNAKGEFFGAVLQKKLYTSYHLMPVYYNPLLLQKIGKALKAHMQGKSCFNFRNVDDHMLQELNVLTRHAFEDYIRLGRISKSKAADM